MNEILNWLEPTIEKRVSEISDDILSDQKNDGYIAFMKLLRNQDNLSLEMIMILGDMFISNTQSTVEEAYRKGVEEILKLKN